MDIYYLVREQYNIEDLDFFYNARTLFYEIGYDDKPVKIHDAVSDDNGYLIHVGIRDGQYNICYYVFVDENEIEECIAGQNLLLNALNNGNIEPIASGLDIEDVFNSLNESTDNYQPNLYLRFEPPIYNDTIGIRQLDKILNLIEDEYPTVSWFQGGSPSQFNPFVHTDEDDGIPEEIKSITIGHWPDKPDLLTYGIWDDNDMGYTNAIDGWLWVEEREVDFDKTSDLFNSLNESDESRIPSAGDYLIFVGSEYGKWFHPLFTVGKVYKVFNTSEGIIEVQNDRGGLSNFSVDLLDNLNWETWFRLAKFDYDKTTEIFNQLNESTRQPKLNLRFEDGISDANELDKVLRVLEIVYPGLKWLGNDPVGTNNVIRNAGEDDFEYEPIHYLTIGYFPNSPDKLTYTSGPADDIDFSDSEQHGYDWVDGWQWVQENDVDYDETSDVFNQLNESYDFLKTTNLIGYSFKTVATTDPRYWIIRHVFNDKGGYVTVTMEYSPLFIIDVGIEGFPTTKTIKKDKVIDFISSGKWEIVSVPNQIDSFDVFDKLNESTRKEDGFTLIFDPPIEDPKTMEMVLMKLQIIHPDWTWVNDKRLIDYNIFDSGEIGFYKGQYDTVVGALTVNHPEWENSKGVSWSSTDYDEPYIRNMPKYNGWEYIEELGDIPTTEDIFNQLD